MAGVRNPSNDPVIESLLPASLAVTEPVPAILPRMLRSMATVESRALNVSSFGAAMTRHTAIDQMIIRVNEVTANSFTNFTEPWRSKELVKELAVTSLTSYSAFKNFRSAA